MSHSLQPHWFFIRMTTDTGWFLSYLVNKKTQSSVCRDVFHFLDVVFFGLLKIALNIDGEKNRGGGFRQSQCVRFLCRGGPVGWAAAGGPGVALIASSSHSPAGPAIVGGSAAGRPNTVLGDPENPKRLLAARGGPSSPLPSLRLLPPPRCWPPPACLPPVCPPPGELPV